MQNECEQGPPAYSWPAAGHEQQRPDVRREDIHMKILLLITALGLIFLPTAWATPQAGSSMRVNGTNHYVHGNTLSEQALAKFEEWKKDGGQPISTSSANWKGYYVELEIKTNSLFITRMTVDAYTESKGFHQMIVPLGAILGSEGPVHASWFTGYLTDYLGPFEGYTHWSSNQRRYHFDKGILIKIEDFTELIH